MFPPPLRTVAWISRGILPGASWASPNLRPLELSSAGAGPHPVTSEVQLRLRACLNAPGTAVVQGGSRCGQGRCSGRRGGHPCFSPCSGVGCPLCRAQQLLVALIQDMAQPRIAARKVRWPASCPDPGRGSRAGPALLPASPPPAHVACGRGRPVQPSFARGSQPHLEWAGRGVGAGQGPVWSGRLLTRGGDPVSPPRAPGLHQGHTLRPACRLS